MALNKQVTVDVQKGKPARISALEVTDGAFVLGNPGLAIDTNFDVQAANAFDVVSGGLIYTVSAGADFDTGTTKVIDADEWGAALLSVDTDGTTYVQFASASGYATEAAAIAALDELTPTGDVVVGYVTILTGSAATWTAGTDALQGGSGGTPSADTNYYNKFGWVL